MMAEMGRIIDAVKELIPREKWPNCKPSRVGANPTLREIISAGVPQAPPVRVISISDRDEAE